MVTAGKPKADSIGIRVEGMRKMRKELELAGFDFQDMKDAHKRIADIIVASARGKAPSKSGALAGSVRGSGAKASSTVRAGGAKVPYANPIHWGWRRSRIPWQEKQKRGIWGGDIRPQTFLADAASQTEPRWLPEYLDYLQTILDRHAEAANGTGD